MEAAASADDPARVINIGSVYGISTAVSSAYAYAASKAGIHHLTRVLARELSRRHINVNAIAPGLFPTSMTRFMLQDDEARRHTLRRIPMGRPGRADEMAGLVLFLCSRAGGYTTGTIMPLDGGLPLSN